MRWKPVPNCFYGVNNVECSIIDDSLGQRMCLLNRNNVVFYEHIKIQGNIAVKKYKWLCWDKINVFGTAVMAFFMHRIFVYFDKIVNSFVKLWKNILNIVIRSIISQIFLVMFVYCEKEFWVLNASMYLVRYKFKVFHWHKSDSNGIFALIGIKYREFRSHLVFNEFEHRSHRIFH